MCGLFGVVRYGKQPNVLVRGLVEELAKASEFRGTDAGGIAYVSGGRLNVSKSHNAISTNGSLEATFEVARVIMGHTRMTTQGDHLNNDNNHPFLNQTKTVAMAHNGVLTNDDALAVEYELPETTIDTDSYVVTRLMDMIRPDGYISFDVVRQAVEKIGGTFNFTFLDDNNNLWIARHNNPLYMIKLNDFGLIAYTSTKEIMVEALNEFLEPDALEYLMNRVGDGAFAEEIPTKSGEIIKITANGDIERENFKPLPYTPYTYYSAPSNYYEKYWQYYKYSDVPEYEEIDRSVDLAIIFNGLEVELVKNFNASGQTWSNYLGCFVDVKDKNVYLIEEYEYVPDMISRERLEDCSLYNIKVRDKISERMVSLHTLSTTYNIDLEDSKPLVDFLTLRYCYNNEVEDVSSKKIWEYMKTELSFMKRESKGLPALDFIAVWLDFYFYESWVREVDKKYA